MDAPQNIPSPCQPPARSKPSIHEQLHIGILLAFVGGFLDIYTYLERGHVFANAQSGNMVLMSLSLANRQWYGALCYALPIFAYALGTRITEHFKRRRMPHWHHFVLILEAIILVGVGFWPISSSNVVVNILISLVCAMQVNSFRTLVGAPYATTMCTGNLRSAIEEWVKFHRDRNREAGWKFVRYITIILAFCAGAVVGVPLSTLFSTYSIWFCVLILAITLFLISHEKVDT